MKLALFTATLGFGLLTTAVPAQGQVRAEVIFGSYPVSGRVTLGDPYYYHDRVVRVYPRYSRRVVVQRYAPRVIVVERYHRGRGHYKHFRHNAFHPTRVWYDPHRVVYYDGYRPGLREVTVYQLDGRYYDEDYYRASDYDDRRYRDRYEYDD
jgi:hypothetical protein